MRVLLDECVPKRLRGSLPDYEVLTVVEMGWSGIKNGKLLALAAKHFDCFLTVDANIEHQQNLPNIPVAILLVRAHSNDPATLAEVAPAIRDALASIQPRMFLTIVPPNNRMRRSDHHKVHAPDCHASVEVSDSALQLRRPVADAGRWTTQEGSAWACV